MKNIFQMALRNARRNARRTLLTVATVMIGTALVTVALSFFVGIFDGLMGASAEMDGHVRIVDKEFAEREQLNPLYANIKDLSAVTAAAKKLPGVVDVEAVISMGVVVTTTELIGDDYGQVVGATDGWFQERLQGPEHLVAGHWLSGAKDEVVVGRKLASDVGAEVGGTMLLLGQTQYGSMSPINAKVVGILALDARADRQAFVRLEDAQWMADMDNAAMQVLVYADSRDAHDVDAVLAAVQASPDLAAYASRAWYQEPMLAARMPVVGAVKGVIQALMAFVTVLAIFNTMTMSVLERTAEVGVLRAMGMGRARVVTMFLMEAGLIGVIGGVSGALIGSAGGLWFQFHGVTFGENLTERMGGMLPMKSTLYADLSPSIVLSALLLGVVTAIVGALLPAIAAARIQPVTAMRSRR